MALTKSAPSRKPLRATPLVLLVDDETTSSRALHQSLLRREPGFEIIEADSPEAALSLIESEQPDAVVSDLSLNPTRGPESGLELIQRILELDPTLRVLVLTGHGAEDLGIKAIQMGAASFLTKPADPDHLIALLKDAIRFSSFKRRVFQFQRPRESLTAITGISSRSPVMQSVLESVAFAASNRQPVLLIGETGVGKGLIASALHRASFPGTQAFIRFQPSFGTHDLTASELFGHQKGAFTGASEQRKGLLEEARGGTLFIDEVDQLQHETQVVLLNALQEKVFRRLGSNKEIKSDFRLIAATNQSLEEILKSGSLRQDFYHRISSCTIEIPPLRERIEDIPDLAQLFFSQLVHRERLQVQGITPEAMNKLSHLSWPGNVRELQAAVEGAVYWASFHGRRFVEISDIPLARKSSSVQAALVSGTSFREQVERFELQLIEAALAKCSDNQSQAAELLQLDRSTLRRISTRERSPSADRQTRKL